jgi:hypothetical protein
MVQWTQLLLGGDPDHCVTGTSTLTSKILRPAHLLSISTTLHTKLTTVLIWQDESEEVKSTREELIKRNQELKDHIASLSAQHTWALENIVNSSDAERDNLSNMIRC